MSTYKPPNSTIFLYDFVLKGNRFYGSTGQKTKRAADRIEAEKRLEAMTNVKRKPPITLDDAASIYEDKLRKTERWSASTEAWLMNLLEGLGAARFIHDINQTDLAKHFAMRAGKISGASVNREIDVARALWLFAARGRYDVGEMPDWGAMRYAVKLHDPRELSFDEEDRLLDAIREDYHPFVKFALLSGWRVSEIRTLLWTDIDFPAKVAWRTVKGGSRISRPLTTEMIVLIASQPQACMQVFTYVCEKSRDKRKAGERYPISKDGWRKVWALALKGAKVSSFRFHDLRHTRGTRILRQTGNLAAAQKALAHKNIKTTLRYAHAADHDVRNALEASESRTIPDVNIDNRQKIRENKA